MNVFVVKEKSCAWYLRRGDTGSFLDASTMTALYNLKSEPLIEESPEDKYRIVLPIELMEGF